jgi:hypothetical protein
MVFRPEGLLPKRVGTKKAVAAPGEGGSQ